MVEFLSPGVIIQEQPGSQQVTQGVSTSNGAFVGFTPKGVTDEATLTTSYEDYVRKFGGDTANSGTTTQVRGFYNNGGKRAFIVRIVPSDAVEADANIRAQISDQAIETGDGAIATFTRTASNTPLLVNAGDTPLVPASLTMRWRGTGTAVPSPGGELRSWDLSARTNLVNLTSAYSARIDPKAALVSAAGAGKVRYRSKVTGQTNIQVEHVFGTEATTSSGISYTGGVVQVQIGTSPGSLTAADLKTAVEGNPESRGVVDVDVLAAGVVGLLPASNLVNGLADFDEELDVAVPGTVTLLWNPDNVLDREIIFPASFGARTSRFDVIRNPADASIDLASTVVIDDGVNPPTTFEFRNDGGPVGTPGHVLVAYAGAASAADIQTAFIAAIQGVGTTLLVTAVAAPSAESGFARTYLTHDLDGVIGITSPDDPDICVGTKVQFDHRNAMVSVEFGGTDIPSAVGTGAYASGTFTIADTFIADNDTIVLDDGINPAITFEYNSSGIVIVAPNVEIDIQGLGTIALVAQATADAINGVGALAISADTPAAGVIPLSNNFPGTQGNQAVVTTFATSASAATPMAGGTFSDYLRASYTPTLAPAVVGTITAPTAYAATSDALGQLQSAGFASIGSMDFSTGAYSFTTTTAAAPYDGGGVLARYQSNAWAATPISKGVWANDFRLEIVGTQDYLTAVTATYSRYTVRVQVKDSTETKLATDPTAAFVTVETYEGVDFTDSASPQYFVDVINEMSDYIRITELGDTATPIEVRQLNGLAREQVIAGGSSAITALSGTLPYSAIYPRSVSITYRDASGVEQTITDDGYGNLIGAVDSGYVAVVGTTNPNTVVYSSGAYNFSPSPVMAAGSLVVASYRSNPVETSHREVFGDTSKGYTAGSDGTFTTTTYGQSQLTSPVLEPTYGGIYALNRIDEIMQVVLPDYAGNVPITKDLLTYAASRANQPAGPDRFMILATPRNYSAQRAVDWFKNDLAEYSKYAAMYWPWVNVPNPLANNRPQTIPPLGIVTGIYARTDSNRNVAKSPAGTVDGKIEGIIGLEYNPTQGDRDYVSPNRINSLIDTPQTGKAVWGARTMASPSETEWRYINARRLFMFLGKSIFNSTHWIMFENNGPGLWVRIKGQLDGFLSGLFSQGYFAGSTAQQAYKVVVDSTNNTPQTIDQGLVVIDAGAAVNKPAEIALFRLTQLQISST